MLTKKTPETIKSSLTIKAMGVENTLLLTYNNRTYDQYKAFVGNPENLKVPDDVVNHDDAVRHMNIALALYVVASFDDGTADDFPVTRDGLLELERTWPGITLCIITCYHRARGSEVEKN